MVTIGNSATDLPVRTRRSREAAPPARAAFFHLSPQRYSVPLSRRFQPPTRASGVRHTRVPRHRRPRQYFRACGVPRRLMPAKNAFGGNESGFCGRPAAPAEVGNGGCYHPVWVTTTNRRLAECRVRVTRRTGSAAARPPRRPCRLGPKDLPLCSGPWGASARFAAHGRRRGRAPGRE